MYTIVRSTHDKWLELRKSGIGSSEVATILHLNPYDTPYRLWRRKTGLDAPIEENRLMKAGHFLEEAVSMFFEDSSEYKVIKRSRGDWMAIDKQRPYMRVSPDRTYWLSSLHSPFNKGILECKTTQRKINGDDDIPLWWFTQLQYQLGVMCYESGALAWLTSGRDFGYSEIGFDKNYFDYMTGEVEKFYTDNILNNEEPSCYDGRDTLIKYPKEIQGSFVEADTRIYESISSLKSIKDDIKNLKEKSDSIEDEIRLYIGGSEKIVGSDSSVLVTLKAPKDSEFFDKQRFRDENPELYGKYLTSKVSERRLIVK